MSDEMQINMITNCAKMEAALKLLRAKMLEYDGTGRCFLSNRELNEVFLVAGLEPVEIKESLTAEEQ